MEESIDLFENIRKVLSIENVDVVNYSPLALAYIGDAIYEIVIRTFVVTKANTQVNKLHKKTSSLVKAQSQAEMMLSLMEELTEEEIRIYKRGRNAKSVSMAKNATMSDYRNATGFEALMGYLYLNKESVRMLKLIKKGLENIEVGEEMRKNNEIWRTYNRR